MAIYRLSSQSIGRSSGKSVIAAAAYRSGEKLQDQSLERTFDYTKKQGIHHSDILLPENAHSELKDRQTLWNKINQSETRSNASLAKEYQLALPGELSHAEKIKLTKAFAQSEFVEKGLGVDLAFHDFDQANPHCHLLVTTRKIDENGINMARKPTFFRERSYLVDLRKSWEIAVNRSLERNQIDQRVCSDSYKKQGINLEGISYNTYGNTPERSLFEQQKTNGEKLLESPHLIFDALNARKATFSKKTMISFINRHSLPEQAENVLKQAICDERLVHLGENRFTSVDYLVAEKELLQSAIHLNTRVSHEVDLNHAREVAQSLTLNESQQDAFAYALKDDAAVKNIIGMAGTGKSHTLKAITEVYQQSGYDVKGLALSGIVAENLAKDANIDDSRTIHSFLWQQQGGSPILDEKTVLVVDEASLIGTKQLSSILKMADQQKAKVILVGDNQQLQAIDAGGAFRGVIGASTHIILNEIQRQRSPDDRLASLHLATGNVEKAFEHYRDDGQTHQNPSMLKTVDAVKTRYFDTFDHAAEASQIVLAFRKDNVKKLNQAIRQGYADRGLLGESTAEVNGKEYAEGDRFVFLKNDYDFGVKNGTTGQIERIVGSEFQIRTDDNRVINFDSQHYQSFDHGYAMTIHKSQGITVDHTHLFLDRHSNSHLAYVGMTRHKETLDLYYLTGENRDAVKNFDHLVQLSSQDKTKDLASDYRDLVNLHEKSAIPDSPSMRETLKSFADWAYNKLEVMTTCQKIQSERSEIKQEMQKLDKEIAQLATLRQEQKILEKTLERGFELSL